MKVWVKDDEFGDFQVDVSKYDLISALQSEGVGERARLCDAHDDLASWRNPDVCRAGVNARDEAACVMYPVLVVPLEDGET